MLSQKSCFNFFIINFLLLLLGTTQYNLLVKISKYTYSYIFIYMIFLLRNIVMERTICYMVKNKQNISNNDRNNCKLNTSSTILFFISCTFIETLTHIYFIKNYNFVESLYWNDLIYFIPVSFGYEILFDFFHYFFHRFEHSYFYKHIHKVHHYIKYPTTLTTYYQHPIDLILSNTIPQILTLLIMSKISFYMYNLIIIYKIYIEISGHCGKIINSCCFPQFIWLGQFFNIELYTEDHDLHHTLNNCNYGKRFCLWDKIFNTYKKN